MLHVDCARLVDVLPGAYLVVTGTGVVVCANAAANRLLGTTGHGALGRPLSELCVEPERLPAMLRQFLRSSQMTPASLRVRAGDAGSASLRVHGALLSPAQEGAEATLLVQLSSRDVATQQFTALTRRIKELNHEISLRKRIEDALAREREWLNVTLSSIGDAVIATDLDSRVTFLNPVAEALTGWPRREAMGQPLPEVFDIINEDTRLPVESPVARVLREGGVVGLANHTVLRTRDGRLLPIDDSAAPIRSRDGEMVGVVLVFHDVSERYQLQRELSRQTAALLDADRRKDEFLAMLAHELRNPLAPLRTAADLLQSGRLGATALSSVSQMMQRQVGLLTRMVDDLLDVARITRGKIEMRPEPIHLRAVLERAVEITAPVMSAHRHSLEVVVPDGDDALRGDAARLAQAVANVLLNAAKFTPPGGCIRLEAVLEADAVTIIVRDNGIGMTPEVAERAFDLFAQGEQSLARAQGGLGIGLTLVRSIVQRHGGQVDGASEGPGTGSTFTLRLPRQHAPLELSQQDAARLRPPSTPRRILLVDDNADAVEMLSSLLGNWGHAVCTTLEAEDAVSLADRFHPDVALLDIGMPGLDGYALAAQLRARFRPPPVLIAISGYGDAEALRRSTEAGFDAHLTKPADPRQLQDLIERLTAGRATRAWTGDSSMPDGTSSP